jgi:hypothetical protein
LKGVAIMGKLKFTRILGLVAVVGFAVSVGSCGLNSSDSTKGVSEGAGNLVATNSTLVAVGLSRILLNASTTLPKPVSTGITAQSTLRDKQCGSGGSVDFTPDNPTDTYEASFADCADENVTVNGSATGTVGPTVECTHADIVEELPTSMTGTFNGTVNVDGQVFTFVNFAADITNVMYGPDCNLDNGSFSAHLNGAITTELSGEDLTMDFGEDSIDVDVEITDPTELPGDRTVSTQVNGEVTLDTFCEKGKVTLETNLPLVSAEGNVCPVTGQLSVSGAYGKSTVDYNGDCSDLIAFCEADLPF